MSSIFLQYRKVEPNWRTGGPFRIFQHPLLQNIEKLKGDPLGNFFLKKSLRMPKKLKRATFSLARYCMLRGKTGQKPF